jgi:hypothetical protein
MKSKGALKHGNCILANNVYEIMNQLKNLNENFQI